MVVAQVEGGGNIKEQVEATERAGNFKKFFTAEPKAKELQEKQAGTERKTNIVFLFGSHKPSYLEKLKELTERKPPNFIILEEEKDEHFPKMLKGEITVPQYMRNIENSGRLYPNTEFSRRKYELLKELSREGVKVEQFEPKLDEATSIKEKEASTTILFMESFARARNFEDAVSCGIIFAKRYGDVIKVKDESRASGIAEKIKSGEWRGDILIEAGSVHTNVKNILIEGFKGNKEISITSLYAQSKYVEEVFGKGTQEIYDPSHELRRAYAYGKKPDEERERLLAARFVVHHQMDKEGAPDRVEYEATRMINQLSYEECKQLFNKINQMNSEEAFKVVEDYLKGRV
jgi:hypothetical protein